jgi:hypothetical protein
LGGRTETQGQDYINIALKEASEVRTLAISNEQLAISNEQLAISN